MQTTDAMLTLSGLTIEAAWENIVKAIGQTELKGGNSLSEQIAANTEQTKKKSQIDALMRKMAVKKQPRRKHEYFELKMEL